MNSLESFPRHLRRDIVISLMENCGTHVIAVASSIKDEENDVKFLSCKGLLPLGSLVYDAQSDSYIVSCKDYFTIGTLPISFIATVKDCPNWSVNVPLTEKLIKKHLTSSQKRSLKKFQSQFDSNFSFFYLQMLDPNI